MLARNHKVAVRATVTPLRIVRSDVRRKRIHHRPVKLARSIQAAKRSAVYVRSTEPSEAAVSVAILRNRINDTRAESAR